MSKSIIFKDKKKDSKFRVQNNNINKSLTFMLQRIISEKKINFL